MSGVPYQFRPVVEDDNVDSLRAQQSLTHVDDASRLSWEPSDDVTADVGQSRAEAADLDTLIGRYGRLSARDLPDDAQPRSDEVHQLIKVRKTPAAAPRIGGACPVV